MCEATGEGVQIALPKGNQETPLPTFHDPFSRLLNGNSLSPAKRGRAGDPARFEVRSLTLAPEGCRPVMLAVPSAVASSATPACPPPTPLRRRAPAFS